jgi:hypothetical protein
MRRGRMFRRRFDVQMDRIQETVGQLETNVRNQAVVLGEQARSTVEQGIKSIGAYEHRLAGSIRKNPALYVGGGLLVAAVLLLMFGRARKVPAE